jgi:hypothetical protein
MNPLNAKDRALYSESRQQDKTTQQHGNPSVVALFFVAGVVLFVAFVWIIER